MFKTNKLIKSFKFAFRGIATIFKTEQNFQLQVLGAIIVLIVATWLRIAVWQWIVIILLILLVFLLEMLNTVFGRLVDMLKPRLHLYAQDIKNIMSAMVLITAISAIIIGLLIFWPYLFN